VHDALQQHFQDQPYVCECAILLQFSGQIDFALLRRRLLIQVDGPHHFEHVNWSKATKVVQHEVDERCNQAALQQGFHMIRIHHHDLHMSQGLITEVLQYISDFERRVNVQCPSMTASVTWSPTFNRARVEGVVRVSRSITL
jgi:hypothetical protein